MANQLNKIFTDDKNIKQLDSHIENKIINSDQDLIEQESQFDIDHTMETNLKEFQNTLEISVEINKIIHFICENIVGREEIVRQSFYAFLTGEHQVMLGRTGMAKSLLARQIFECFENANVFEKQLTKDTMPDNLFGAYDMEEMKRGKMMHNVEGSIVKADFAFLDEIFDANDMLLRSLLSLLNERKLINGEQILVSPLNTVIAASNYIRATEMLEAVLDRFLYKSYIPENKNLYYQFTIDHIYGKNVGNIKPSENKLDLKDLKILKRLVKTQIIKIPDYVLFLKNYILRQYIEETKKNEGVYNFTISDRTSAKVQDLLRVSAILDKRYVVAEQDLDNLYLLICMVGKEEEKIRLKGIIDTTKRYFSQDKELINKLFDIIKIFHTIKYSKDPNSIVEHKNFIYLLNRIEESFVESSMKNRLKIFINKLTFRPNKSKLTHMLEIFQESCGLLRNMATKKETLELIEGFEYDIEHFHDKNYLYLQFKSGNA